MQALFLRAFPRKKHGLKIRVSAVRFRPQPRAPAQFHCGKEIGHSFCRYGRSTSAAAVTEISTVIRPAAQHDHQVARSRGAGVGSPDSADDDYWRVERSIAAA